MAEVGDLKIVMFDDAKARRWQPFRLTRPVGELRFGCMTLQSRMGWILGGRTWAYLGCDDLAGFEESDEALVHPEGNPQTPHIAPGGEYPDREKGTHQHNVVISSRAVLDGVAGTVIKQRAA